MGDHFKLNGVKPRIERHARDFALTLAPHIVAARSGGATTLQALADHLNAAGVPTREGTTWYPASVGLVVKRLEQSVNPSRLAEADAC